jgi:hypothetical protein
MRELLYQQLPFFITPLFCLPFFFLFIICIFQLRFFRVPAVNPYGTPVVSHPCTASCHCAKPEFELATLVFELTRLDKNMAKTLSYIQSN